MVLLREKTETPLRVKRFCWGNTFCFALELEINARVSCMKSKVSTTVVHSFGGMPLKRYPKLDWVLPRRYMNPRIAVNVAQHKIINLKIMRFIQNKTPKCQSRLISDCLVVGMENDRKWAQKCLGGR